MKSKAVTNNESVANQNKSTTRISVEWKWNPIEFLSCAHWCVPIILIIAIYWSPIDIEIYRYEHEYICETVTIASLATAHCVLSSLTIKRIATNGTARREHQGIKFTYTHQCEPLGT